MTTADGWPFVDEPNLACITLRRVLSGDRPILMVAHEPGEGGWQFLDGHAFAEEELAVVGLQQMVECDPSLMVLWDLPIGWMAVRDRTDTSWNRSKLTPN